MENHEEGGSGGETTNRQKGYEGGGGETNR